VSPSGGIRVRDLAKRYGSVTAVSGVSFDVHPGEVFGLLGPNGAGKTTILECILGLRRPDGGSITVNGIDGLGSPGLARAQMGAQLQSAALQDRITPREAVTLFGGFYPNAIPARELLETFGLTEKADALFQSLSGGQRQRLFLALALVHRPAVVILDEPAAGLDPEARRDFHRLVTGLRSAARCVLLSTHDLEEAGRLCDRVAILARGQVATIVSPAELAARTGGLTTVYVEASCVLADEPLQALAAVRAVDEAGGKLIELSVRRPTLEDVYFKLTGSDWPARETARPDSGGRTQAKSGTKK
jgi:ABC-2 type transport system ATP-binding protein